MNNVGQKGAEAQKLSFLLLKIKTNKYNKNKIKFSSRFAITKLYTFFDLYEM